MATGRKLRPDHQQAASVSIVIVQGAHSDSEPLGADFYAGLRRLAAAVGRRLDVRPCANLREFLAQLGSARAGNAEFVLIDPGELASQALAQPEPLRQALDALPSAYIEVHDDSAQVLDLQVHPRNAPIVTLVVNDDRTQGYSLALAIALRRLSRRMDEPRTPFIA